MPRSALAPPTQHNTRLKLRPGVTCLLVWLPVPQLRQLLLQSRQVLRTGLLDFLFAALQPSLLQSQCGYCCGPLHGAPGALLHSLFFSDGLQLSFGLARML